MVLDGKIHLWFWMVLDGFGWSINGYGWFLLKENPMKIDWDA